MARKKKRLLEKTFAAIAPVLELDLDPKRWTAGPQRFAQVPTWAKGGLVKPTTRRGLEQTDNVKPLKKIRPFKNLTIYPSVDPIPPEQRQLYTVLMTECWPILKCNKILQQLTIQKSSRGILPRQNQEINEEALKEWEDTPIDIPFAHMYPNEQKNLKPQMTPNEIKTWMDEYCTTLDLDSIVFDVFLFEREQGRCAIGMFPETRNKRGEYKLAEALRLIRPDLMRRPIIDFDDGEFVGVEITGLSSNGSVLDGNRCAYFQNGKNLELFGDLYGVPSVQAIADLGQALLIIYARDIINAANKTWRTSNVWQHDLPTNVYSKAKAILEDFNHDLANIGNSDISIPHNVTLVNGSGTNSGDIAGLKTIEDMCIEGIAGFNHIPPYKLAKGEAGNLGGNANLEENESLLNEEIKPVQERYEKTLESQFYDRILAILFMVEPDMTDDIPIKITHNFEKPIFATAIDPAEWNIMMYLRDGGFTTMDQVMERYGLREMMSNSPTQGADTSPTIKTWERQRHPTWNRNGQNNGWKNNSWVTPNLKDTWNASPLKWGDELHKSKIGVLKSAKEQMDIKNKIDKKKLDRK